MRHCPPSSITPAVRVDEPATRPASAVSGTTDQPADPARRDCDYSTAPGTARGGERLPAKGRENIDSRGADADVQYAPPARS